MIYYKIEDDLSEHKNTNNYKGDTVIIITEKELKKEIAEKVISKDIIPRYKNAKCCRSTVHADSLSACFSIISKNKKMKRHNFGFILVPNRLTFIDSDKTVSSYIKKMYKNKFHKSIKIGRFLYDFLATLIENDLRYLEEMGDRLVKIESAVTKGHLGNFNDLMVSLRKEALLFYRYYTQLVDLGKELQENENEFFTKEEIEFFEKFTRRAQMLREESHILREYSNQVRDVYHSQVNAKQNKIIKLLTAITIIFMPISITTTWYGMNFSDMPELSFGHGYPVFIASNLLIVLFLAIYLKKKKFM